jgi:hypothetical protein
MYLYYPIKDALHETTLGQAGFCRLDSMDEKKLTFVYGHM